MDSAVAYERQIGPRRWIGVEVMTYGKGRLYVGDRWSHDDTF